MPPKHLDYRQEIHKNAFSEFHVKQVENEQDIWHDRKVGLSEEWV
jgi:hypothetical protein